MMRLPKRLRYLRAHLRLVFGRGRYPEAHAYAERVYHMENEDRRGARERARASLREKETTG